MIFYRKFRISIGNFEFLSGTLNFYRVEPSKYVIFIGNRFICIDKHVWHQPMSQNVIENILCFFYRKLRISIGNIEFLSDWPLKILYFHRTTMPDTRRCHRMSLRITYGFLSEISNFYREHWISIGLNPQNMLFSSGIVSFVSTNMFDTSRCHRMLLRTFYVFSIGNFEFLSGTLNFYRIDLSKYCIFIGQPCPTPDDVTECHWE